MTVKLFEVGGCVRDKLLGVPSKDVDFAVEAESFEAMEQHIKAEGLKVFLSKPEFLTIRAGVPKGHPLRARCKDADFVLCRKDGPTTDGRRPDSVEPGTIFDDLARRDFTVNAIAVDVQSGEVIDPHGGAADLEARRLSFVGNPHARVEEDGLRLLRGLRFSLTKHLTIAEPLAFRGDVKHLLRSVATERISDELNKMLAASTICTLVLLEEFWEIRDAVFERPGISLMATMKKRK